MEAVIFLSIIIALFLYFLFPALLFRRVKKTDSEITDALIDVKKRKWKQTYFICNK